MFDWVIYRLLKMTLRKCKYRNCYNAQLFVFLLKSVIQKQSLRAALSKGVLKIFAKFTGKYLCQSLGFIKREALARCCFPLNFPKFLRTVFLQNTSDGCFQLLLWKNNCSSQHSIWSIFWLKGFKVGRRVHTLSVK